MKTIVRFEFDTPIFYPAYNGPRNVIFENPAHIPSTGDPVNFKISDFFSDKQVIEKFEEINEGSLLYAERLQAKYSKEEIEVMVVIYEEAVFKEHFPQFFSNSVV